MISKQDAREFFEYTLGRKSHLNVAGKIIGAPFVVAAFVTYWTFDFLFTKRGRE